GRAEPRADRGAPAARRAARRGRRPARRAVRLRPLPRAPSRRPRRRAGARPDRGPGIEPPRRRVQPTVPPNRAATNRAGRAKSRAGQPLDSVGAVLGRSPTRSLPVNRELVASLLSPLVLAFAATAQAQDPRVGTFDLIGGTSNGEATTAVVRIAADAT